MQFGQCPVSRKVFIFVWNVLSAAGDLWHCMQIYPLQTEFYMPGLSTALHLSNCTYKWKQSAEKLQNTTICCCVGLFTLLGSGEPGPELFCLPLTAWILGLSDSAWSAWRLLITGNLEPAVSFGALALAHVIWTTLRNTWSSLWKHAVPPGTIYLRVLSVN